MNVRKILVVALVLVLALSVFATGCKAAPKLAEKQILRMNLGTEPPQLNSTLTTDTVSFDLLRHTMEGLTRLDANDKPIPGMAEKWTTSADGLTITFTDQATGQGVTFTVPGQGEVEKCFDPGTYSYTLDAPPPWSSTNDVLTVQPGDLFLFPISPQE